MENRSSGRMRTLGPEWPDRGLSANQIACALISVMVRSQNALQAKAGYIDARPLTATRRNLLATHGRTDLCNRRRPFDFRYPPLTTEVVWRRNMSRRAQKATSVRRGDSVELDALQPGDFRTMVRAVIEQPLGRGT